jgi:hypothetical protein
MKSVATLYFLCVLAAWIPSRSKPAQRENTANAFPGWATAPLPTDLAPVNPSEREARFAADFPGEIGVFTDGTRTYVVRWVRTSTRKLHPASDCLRALGYDVKPTPIFAAVDGSHWGTSSAQRDSEQLRVRERIIDSTGREWTDVSAWFWSAALGHSTGPWWAITIFEPANTNRLKTPL